MYKPELFQLQKFYNKKHLWFTCFPEFFVKCQQTEAELEKLTGASFGQTAKPRLSLMNWFLEKIKYVNNIQEILQFVPDEEKIPADGELLTKEEFVAKYHSDKLEEKSVKESDKENGKKKFKLIANFHAVGGGEMSVINLTKMFLEKGYEVELIPTQTVNSNLRRRMDSQVIIGESLRGNPVGNCDILMIYANDFVYKLGKNKDKLIKLMDSSGRCVTCLNFVMGEAWQDWFSARMDKFLFLNTDKEKDLLGRWRKKKMKERPTKALAPPVFLEEYLKTTPNYGVLNFVRTGRYGGKYDDEAYKKIISGWMTISPESEYWFMATPPFVNKHFGGNEKFHNYGWDGQRVSSVLANGSLFHYHLPQSMRDQGPRVAVEAMASGLPIVAQKRDGMKDRLTEETGWFADTPDDFINVVKEIKSDLSILKQKGEQARERAKKVFDPYNWVKEIEN